MLHARTLARVQFTSLNLRTQKTKKNGAKLFSWAPGVGAGGGGAERDDRPSPSVNVCVFAYEPVTICDDPVLGRWHPSPLSGRFFSGVFAIAAAYSSEVFPSEAVFAAITAFASL